MGRNIYSEVRAGVSDGALFCKLQSAGGPDRLRALVGDRPQVCVCVRKRGREGGRGGGTRHKCVCEWGGEGGGTASRPKVMQGLTAHTYTQTHSLTHALTHSLTHSHTHTHTHTHMGSSDLIGEPANRLNQFLHSATPSALEPEEHAWRVTSIGQLYTLAAGVELLLRDKVQVSRAEALRAVRRRDRRGGTEGPTGTRKESRAGREIQRHRDRGREGESRASVEVEKKRAAAAAAPI